MKPLNSAEIDTIRNIVNGHWTSLGISTYGAENVGDIHPEIQQLIQRGVITHQAAALLDPVADAYIFGFLRRKLEQSGVDVKELSLDEFHGMLQRDPIPLSDAENASIAFAKKWGGQYARTVAERAAGRAVAKLAEIDTESFLADQKGNFIGESTAEALKDRWSPDSLAARLRAESGDNITDWDRVAATEIQNAVENGTADDIQQSFGGDPLVAKEVNPTACEYCKKVYLDDRGFPKIFKLSELRANGDNIGKKKENWLPVVGVVHPWCACTLIYIPQGFGFNDAGELTKIT